MIQSQVIDLVKSKALNCRNLIDFIKIWQLSFERNQFVVGSFVKEALNQLDQYPHLLCISSRGLFKSTRAKMELAFNILTSKKDMKCALYSATPELSKMHAKDLKDTLAKNPIFKVLCKDLKPQSDSLIKYKNMHGKIIEVIPLGIGVANRGRHWHDLVILDDVMKGDGVLIDKTNAIVKQVITPMIKSGCKVRILATALTSRDFIFDEDFTNDFKVVTQPALDDDDKSVFEELYATDWLHKRRNQIGHRNFELEFQCKVLHEGDPFLDPESIYRNINEKSPNLDRYRGKYRVIAGADIQSSRKSKHATHMVAFVQRDDILYQIKSEWLAGATYTAQFQRFKTMIKNLNISRFYVDNSNSAFDPFFQSGHAPPEMCEVRIKDRKTKEHMASCLELAFANDEIRLIKDDRQTRSLLQTQANLKSSVTADGHSDAFTSIGMAVMHKDERLLYAFI